MRSKYDLLMTDKEPIIYLEHAKVFSKDNCLVAYKSDGTKQFVPPASTMLLLLGAGTSITQKAGIIAAHSDMSICFVRGGCYMHSIWHSGRWPPPDKIVKQCILHNDSKSKLNVAKNDFKIKIV